MALRPYETEAIVVRTIPFGETSQIVHLATPNHGRVTALAKGAHRPGPAFQGGVPLGTLGSAHLRPRKGAELELLTRYRWLPTLAGLADDTNRYFAAHYVLELARTWMQPAAPTPALYLATKTALRALAQAPTSRVAAWIVWYEARALAAAGHRPQLDRCAACGKAVGALSFVPALGGAAHVRCRGTHAALHVSPAGWEGLRRLYTARIGELAAEPLSPAAVAQARRVHGAFVPWVLEREPQALRWIARGAVTES